MGSIPRFRDTQSGIVFSQEKRAEFSIFSKLGIACSFSVVALFSSELFSASQRSDEVRLCAGKVGAISRVRKQKDTLYTTDVRDCREVRLPRSEIAARCILVCICRTVC